MRSVLAMTAVTVLASAAAGQEPAPPRPARAIPIIDTIAVLTGDVFQPEEVQLNPTYGAMNGLHIKTRPSVVRRELLFKQGEPYDSAKVAETRRNLNRLGLFRAVQVDTVTSGGRFVVVVQTLDVWTTGVGLNARSTGGTFTWSVTGSEANLLGTGNSIQMGYNHDVDRNFYSVGAGTRRLLGTGADGSLSYRKYSDGHSFGGTVTSPFRSFSDRSSYSFSGVTTSARVLQFRDGRRFDSLHLENQRVTVRVDFAPVARTSHYVRAGLIAQVRNERLARIRGPVPALPDSVTAAVGVGLDVRQSRFKVVTHYNGFARDEDIDLGARLTGQVMAAPRAFGYQRNGVGLWGSGQVGVPLGDSFLRLVVRAGGLFTGVGLDSGGASGTFVTAIRVIPRQPTIFYLSGGILKNPAPGSEFDLGHSGSGPRAFGPHAYSGTRMLWGTIEHRVFLIDEVLSVFGVGFAAFLDYGGAWYGDEPARKGGNVGFGLRLGPTRATGTNLGRFDVAYKFGDGVTGGRWVFSFGRSFTY